MTFDELKSKQRWVLWKLETIKAVNGSPDKQTKVPYQANGRKARNNDPTTWKTYAELEPHAHKYSGVGVVLGEIDGLCLWGVDFDKCADAVSGRFSPETREVVIQLVTGRTVEDTEIKELLRDVLRGSSSGMDKDSLFAAATLLLETKTNNAVIRLLQARELHGWLDAKGEVCLCVCGGSCDHSETTEAA